jgi:hypothetical protein
MTPIDPEHLKQALRDVLNEAFFNVEGIFLDRKTSLFETLADITAGEASIPVGGKCATLAAQVKHVAFYLDVVDRSVRDPNTPRADWGEIWRTMSAVSPDEWDAIRDELRASYKRILTLIDDTPDWNSIDVIASAVGIVAHSAYHLGEIRQALCTLRP